MKKVFFVSILFTSILLRAQPYNAENVGLLNTFLYYSFLEKPIDGEIKLVKADLNREILVSDSDFVRKPNGSSFVSKGDLLSGILNKFSTKPTLIILWKVQANQYSEETLATLKKIQQLVDEQQENYNLLFVNISDLGDPNDGLGKLINKTEYIKESFRRANVKLDKLPFYVDYNLAFDRNYKTSSPFTVLILNSKKYISEVLLNLEEVQSFDFLNNFKEITNTSGVLLFDGNSNRVEDPSKASLIVKRTEKDQLIFIEGLEAATNKTFFKYSYKTTGINPYNAQDNFFLHGPFEYHNIKDNFVQIKGDASDGFLNNFTYYITPTQLAIDGKNLNTFNKSFINNASEVYHNLQERKKAKPQTGEILSVITQYYENGSKSEIMEYNSKGKLTSYKNWYKNGKLSNEFEWNINKNYNEEGVLIKTYQYSEEGEIDGLYKTFHNNGKNKLVVNYNNGKKEGFEKQYYTNGNLKQSLYYKNGDADYMKREIYYENGMSREITTDKKTSYYYDNGQIFWEKLNDRTGLQDVFYHRNGKKYAVINYDSSKYMNCSSDFFDEQGNKQKKPYVLQKKRKQLFEIYAAINDLYYEKTGNDLLDNVNEQSLESSENNFNLRLYIDEKMVHRMKIDFVCE